MIEGDVGGLGDIARRTRGTWGLVEAGAEDQLTDKIRNAMLDQKGLQSERAAVRERVAAHYTWRALAQRMVAGYDSVRARR